MRKITARRCRAGAPPCHPVATEQLVARGLYQYVRSPMYLAVLTVITGHALLLSRPALLGRTAAIGAAFTVFAHWYEQLALARRYGAQYEACRRAARRVRGLGHMSGSTAAANPRWPSRVPSSWRRG